MKYVVAFKGNRLVQVHASCRQTAITKALAATNLTVSHVVGVYKF